MSNRLAVGAAHLADRLKATASVTVTYRRGAASVVLSATPGSSLLRVSQPGGVERTLRTDRDYIITAADLVLSGNVTEPARDDLIDETGADGVTRRYKVLPPGQDEPAWRYSDQARLILRIHTKGQGVVA